MGRNGNDEIYEETSKQRSFFGYINDIAGLVHNEAEFGFVTRSLQLARNNQYASFCSCEPNQRIHCFVGIVGGMAEQHHRFRCVFVATNKRCFWRVRRIARDSEISREHWTRSSERVYHPQVSAWYKSSKCR